MTLLFLNALFGLVAFDLLLAIGKFAAVHRTLRRRKVANAHGTADVTEQVLRAVNLACMWYPKRALCLQRSFVTVCLLRNHGISAQMVLGAQKIPFIAHAWVEVDGCAVNERSNVQARYGVWERC